MEKKWRENHEKKILPRPKLKFATFSRLSLRPERWKRNICKLFFSSFREFQTDPKESEEGILNSIPIETALKIVSSLQVSDVCSLSSCSRFWRELCGSDCVWEPLYRERWPALDPLTKPSLMGWRERYINKHKDVEHFATHVVQQFSGIETIEVEQYLSVIEGMCLVEFGFKDVQMFFFEQSLNVLINLIGLHYCISWLGVPIAYVGEALDSCKISQRTVCVKRTMIDFGCCITRDSIAAYFCRTLSLADISLGNEDEVLGVLRGEVLIRREVPIPGSLCVQISVKNLGPRAFRPWS